MLLSKATYEGGSYHCVVPLGIEPRQGSCANHYTMEPQMTRAFVNICLILSKSEVLSLCRRHNHLLLCAFPLYPQVQVIQPKLCISEKNNRIGQHTTDSNQHSTNHNPDPVSTKPQDAARASRNTNCHKKNNFPQHCCCYDLLFMFKGSDIILLQNLTN